jgi:hypothetical protein
MSRGTVTPVAGAVTQCLLSGGSFSPTIDPPKHHIYHCIVLSLHSSCKLIGTITSCPPVTRDVAPGQKPEIGRNFRVATNYTARRPCPDSPLCMSLWSPGTRGNRVRNRVFKLAFIVRPMQMHFPGTPIGSTARSPGTGLSRSVGCPTTKSG